MASVLFEITLERRLPGRRTFASKLGTVKAVPAECAGYLPPVDGPEFPHGTLLKPDLAAVRDCLPRALWAAWDRSGPSFRYTSANGAEPTDRPTVAILTLRGSRGAVLGYLYARMYVFTPR